MSRDATERTAAVAMAVGAALIYYGTSESDYPLRELALAVGILVFALSVAVLL